MSASDLERLQRAFLDNVPDMAWLKDRSSRYEAVNAAYLNASGFSAEEIVGRTPAEIWPADIAATYLETDRAVLSSGKPRRYEETRTLADGKVHWFDTIKSPVRDPHGQVVGTVGISRDITDRKAAEAELVASRAKIRALSTFLETARENERARMARELHDELGQTLTGLKLGLRALRDAKSSSVDVAAARIDALTGMVDAAVVDLRRIAADLRPLMLDELGLGPAVEWLTGNFSTRHAIPVSLALAQLPPEISGECATAIFRILQELLTNVAKHANATAVSVTLCSERGEIDLEVSDNGGGIPMARRGQNAGFGLLGMEERAINIGGTLSLSSAPGRGTTVRARLPLRLERREERA